MKTVRILAAVAALAVAGAAHAADPSFAGTWTFNPSISENVGMMAAVKQTQAITQTAKELVVTESSDFNGKVTTREVRYDLAGKPRPNEGPMGAKSETVTKWDGGKLVTTWTSEGAVAGTKSVRTETRSLSADGRKMSVSSVRGENKPMVMVYEKTK